MKMEMCDLSSNEHYFSSSESKAWKYLSLHESGTHDLCYMHC